MNQEKKLATIRVFLDRDDLEGTDFKLKENCLKLDRELSKVRAELEQMIAKQKELTQVVNQKNLEVVQVSQQLEGLCALILDLESEVD
jgi:uncharacterized protein YoxC